MKAKLILAVPMIAFFVFSAFGASPKEKSSDVLSAFELIDAGTYTFDAQSMTAAKGANVMLSSSYSLTVDGDSANAYLPYAGRAYGGSYGGDGAIEFATAMKDHEVELKEKKKEKNNQKIVSFKVNGDNDIYTCRLTVSKSGSASLSISSNNRQSIGFSGHISAVDEEK